MKILGKSKQIKLTEILMAVENKNEGTQEETLNVQ